MLYWAEGAKAKNSVLLANSDPHMLAFFRRFLTDRFDVPPSDFTMSVNVYLNNGISIDEIEGYWLGVLELPQTCVRTHILNHMPTSSSGQRRNKLPYGVCRLRVHSTRIVQHIFGAIQEYADFDEPRWLDCAPRPVEVADASVPRRVLQQRRDDGVPGVAGDLVAGGFEGDQVGGGDLVGEDVAVAVGDDRVFGAVEDEGGGA